MSLAINILGPAPSNALPGRSVRLDDDDSSSGSSDSPTGQSQSRRTATSYNPTETSIEPEFLHPPTRSGRSSTSTTTSSTPIPSRSTSPLPFYPAHLYQGQYGSESDSENNSPLLRTPRNDLWREDRSWWQIGSRSRRRRKRTTVVRFFRSCTKRLVMHPLFPGRPLTVILALLLLSLFAISLTLLLIYILNPDKEPLPWRAYCSIPPASTRPPGYYPTNATDPILSGATGIPTFPPENFDSLTPAGILMGVFSMDSSFERRMIVRSTWASHPRSREGAGEGDKGAGTSRAVVRFILGQPRKDYERHIKLEMEIYNDIVILPGAENMNGGKTHMFFTWASTNAWVPPLYANVSTSTPPRFSYSNASITPPHLAPHDPQQAWDDRLNAKWQHWVRPDFVVKVDDDSFVMMAELEARLRVELHAKPVTDHFAAGLATPHTIRMASLDPLIYWGYWVKHRFMGGELYALSWSLIDWAANDPVVKTMTRGKEDVQTSKWMMIHPQADQVRWATDRCWIYDHPRAGTVYSHGFLFPSEVRRVRQTITSYLGKTPQEVMASPPALRGGYIATPLSWAHSSVSTFGVRYTPPVVDLTTAQSVEALIEGSNMSKLREGMPITPDYAWTHREGRKTQYQGHRIGGTVVVHFIKKNMWFFETASALLQGDEFSDAEKLKLQEQAGGLPLSKTPTPLPKRYPTR